MKSLEQFLPNLWLPVNVAEAETRLIHSLVSSPTSKIECQGQPIEIGMEFKCLGIVIT